MNRACQRAAALFSLLVLAGALVTGCQDADPPLAANPDPPDDLPRVLRVPGEYASIQQALDEARPADTVLVAPGTYRGAGNRDLDFGGRDLVLRSEGGAETTELDCDLAGRAFYLRGGETRSAVIEGFTIRNGLAADPSAGGGARFDDCAPTLRDCRFLACYAAFGGGVYGEGADPLFEHCEFRANRTSGLDGGALYLNRGNAEIVDCVITGNRARRGGGLYCDASDVLVLRSTLAGNFADEEGGGAYVRRLSSPRFEQTILWGNGSGKAGAQASVKSGTTLTVTCSATDSSAIEGSGTLALVNGVFADPVFCSPLLPALAPTTEGSYRVDEESPCRPKRNPCGLLIGASEASCAPNPREVAP